MAERSKARDSSLKLGTASTVLRIRVSKDAGVRIPPFSKPYILNFAFAKGIRVMVLYFCVRIKNFTMFGVCLVFGR